jgi:hypothetical protein
MMYDDSSDIVDEPEEEENADWMNRINEPDIDYGNVECSANMLRTEPWNKTQLCAEQFPKPIRVGKKTTSTLCGLTDEDFVQVTSSPHIIVIPMRFKHRLCRKLNDFGVIVSEATTPESLIPGKFGPLVRACQQIEGSRLCRALRDIGVNSVRVLTVGGRLSREQFDDILNFAIDGTHCIDVSVVHQQREGCIPLVYVDEPNNEPNCCRHHTMRLLDTESGFVSIDIDKHRFGHNPQSWAEYCVIYPLLEHVHRSLRMNAHVHFKMTNKNVKSARDHLRSHINKIRDVSYREHLAIHSRGVRTETRWVVRGDKNNIASLLDRLDGAYGEIENNTGVKIMIEEVPLDYYYTLLSEVESIVQSTWYFSPTQSKSVAPSIVVARLLDLFAIVGRSPGVPLNAYVGKYQTWRYNQNNQAFNIKQLKLKATDIRDDKLRALNEQTTFIDLARLAKQKDGVLRVGDSIQPDEKDAILSDIRLNCKFRGGLHKLTWVQHHNGASACGDKNKETLIERVFEKFGSDWRLHLTAITESEQPPKQNEVPSNADGLPLASAPRLIEHRANAEIRERAQFYDNNNQHYDNYDNNNQQHQFHDVTSMVPVGSGNRRCAHRDQRAK